MIGGETCNSTTHQLHRRSHVIALGTSDDTSISRTTPLSRLQAPQVAIVWPKYAPSSTSAAYNLGREVAVDEAMIKFQGRSALKQYLLNKPVKRGIKVWVLADGYFHMLQVYTGREATPEKQLGARVVKDLTASLKHMQAPPRLF